MRAAAILGLGCSTSDLKPFQRESDATWLVGLPATAREADAILIFGGDGTVHRHLRQLVKLQLPVLVVPRGSGNDFARALKLRGIRDTLAAWRKFSSGGSNVRTIDLGVITPLESTQGLKPNDGSFPGAAEALPSTVAGNVKPETGNSTYFCCVGGVGLDGEIARRANDLPRWLRGHGGYALSSLPTLFRVAAIPMKITVSGSKDPPVARSSKPTVLAAFANTPVYGGGMKIAPRAQPDDGLLDVCVIRDIDKFKLFCLFPTVYFGRHLSMPEVEYFQADRLRLETERPLDVYADGEYVCQTPIQVGVARAAIKVIVHPSQTSF
jgi:diacylglycerol kinase (ATP)